MKGIHGNEQKGCCQACRRDLEKLQASLAERLASAMSTLKHIVYAGLLAGLLTTQTYAAETYRVSVGPNGSNGPASSPSISGDGRFVTFDSAASNLVPNDGNGARDIFVHDRVDGSIERVSVSFSGTEGNVNSFAPSISGDGRFVAFSSFATNLVLNDAGGRSDIFVHDRMDGRIERVSINSGGEGGNNSSFTPSISGDGRFVAFNSFASNLVRNDGNGKEDIFVHDRMDGSIDRVSVNFSGTEGNGSSFAPSISGDGRFVAFNSFASNLVSNDGNGESDIFVHDRMDGSIERVSVNSGGTAGNAGSHSPSISGDGRFVAFPSFATNLVSNDGNGAQDIFVHDRTDGSIERVSVNSGGTAGNAESFSPSISGDGRFVAFHSRAANLVPNDVFNTQDIFVYDRIDGSIERVSVNSGGTAGNAGSSDPSISGDGRFVAFDSTATNLVPNDGNSRTDIFVHDQGALCDVNDPANQITLVNNQWAQLAVPCLPPDGASVGDVFGSHIDNPADYAVYFYNGVSYMNADADSPLTLGQGMWVIQKSGRDVTVTLPPGSRSGSSNFNTVACTDENIGCQSIPVNTPQWLMVGVPFSLNGGIPLDDVLVTTTDAACPNEGCTVAQADGPLLDTLFHFQYPAYQTVTGADPLESWAGYWAAVNSDPAPANPALLFPEMRVPELIVLDGTQVVDTGIFISLAQGDSLSFTVKNIGDAMAANIAFNVGENDQLVNTSGVLCGSPSGFLAPGASCEVMVSNPSALGTYEQNNIKISYENLFQNTPFETGSFSLTLNNCPAGSNDPFCI